VLFTQFHNFVASLFLIFFIVINILHELLSSPEHLAYLFTARKMFARRNNVLKIQARFFIANVPSEKLLIIKNKALGIFFWDVICFFFLWKEFRAFILEVFSKFLEFLLKKIVW